jgi:parallel beta-helix repeat protein
MKSVCLLKLFLFPLLLLAAFPLFAKPPQVVEGCEAFIDEAGKYLLNGDLLDCPEFGIAIVVSDVTLDLKGHTISCAYSEARSGGVIIGSYIFGGQDYVSNVKVTNGAVTGCSDGILLAGAIDSKVTKMTSWGNRLWYGPDGPVSGTGITVWLSENNVIMHNHVYGNEDVGIFSWYASGNLYKHNLATDNFSGIQIGYENNAEVLCNRTHENALGIIVGVDSDDNLVRGNLVTYNYYDGISLVGIITPPLEEGGPLQVSEGSAGNTIRSNIAEHNDLADASASDLFEGFWDFSAGGGEPFYVLHPDGCMNTWKNNQYGTALAPLGCIAAPVILEEDDVCALDDD